MSQPLNLSPYTVTVQPDGQHVILLDGASIHSLRAGEIAIRIDALLNAAYKKGVEDERARQGHETPEQMIARINTPEHHAAMKAWIESFPTIDKVEQIEVPPSLQPLLDKVADAWDKRPSKNQPPSPYPFMGAGACLVPADMLPVESAPQPPIYPIAEREPIFPCYLYTNVRTGVYRWVRYGHEADGHFVAKRFDQLPEFAKKATTHWSPDAPNPPSIKP